MQEIEPFIVDNYIVRIYRRDEENPHKIVGIVEQAGTEIKHPFHDVDELWTILKSANSRLPKHGRNINKKK